MPNQLKYVKFLQDGGKFDFYKSNFATNQWPGKLGNLGLDLDSIDNYKFIDSNLKKYQNVYDASKTDNPPAGSRDPFMQNFLNIAIKSNAAKLKASNNDDSDDSDGDSDEDGDDDKKKLNFGQKLNKVVGSKGFQMGLQVANSALTALDGFSADKDVNSVDASTKKLRNGIADAVSTLGPWGMLAGTAVKGIGFTGGFSHASSGLGTGTDIANGIASIALPGSGWFAKKTHQLEKDQRIASSSGYTGTSSNVDDAMKNANAKILFGNGKANRKIDKAAGQQNMALNNLDKADIDMSASTNPLISNRVMLNMTGGYNPMIAAQKGAKLYNREYAQNIIDKIKSKKTSKKKKIEKKDESIALEQYKQGGAFNVIPEGALHKNKHHLDEVDEKFEDVTTKGIPIVSEKENGKVSQQAEVEKEEIIFRLDVTKELEDLAKKDDDEAAIKAGKLLVKEILYNTKDNTNNIL